MDEAIAGFERVNEILEMNAAGAVCIDHRLINKLAGILSPEDFQSEKCRAVFVMACEARRNGKPFDAAIAAHQLARKMGDDAARKFIAECMRQTPTTANAEYRAQLLHDAASGARFRASLLQLAGSSFGSGKDLAAAVMTHCREFLDGEKTGRTVKLRDALTEVYQALSWGEKQACINTGFEKLDRLLKGVWAGNLCIIGARPGVGKSAMGLSIAQTTAKNGGAVLIYSMEMLAGELAERMIVRETAGLELDNLIDGGLNEEQYSETVEACTRLAKLPILINDAPDMTVSKIRAEAADIENLRLIIVDFVSLMHGEKYRKYDSRNLELGAISRDLKNLAAELKIPIIALAQLNRGKSDKEIPTMMELRDSGELEQNANKILLMWYTNREEREIGVRVEKNRRGKTGNVQFRFDGAHMRFYEIDYIHDEPQSGEKRVNKAWQTQ